MRLVDTIFQDEIVTCDGEEAALFHTNELTMKEIKHFEEEENGGQASGLKAKYCKKCSGYHIETPENKGLIIPKRPQGTGDRTQRGRRTWSGDGVGRRPRG